MSRFMDRFSMLICRIGAIGALIIGGLGLATLIFGSGRERYATAILFGIASAASWLAGRAARVLVMRK